MASKTDPLPSNWSAPCTKRRAAGSAADGSKLLCRNGRGRLMPTTVDHWSETGAKALPELTQRELSFLVSERPQRAFIGRRLADVDASQGLSILAAKEGCDSVVSGRLLPLVWCLTLFAEIYKKELDCECDDVLFGINVHDMELSQHLNIIPGDARPFELSIATKVSSP